MKTHRVLVLVIFCALAVTNVPATAELLPASLLISVDGVVTEYHLEGMLNDDGTFSGNGGVETADYAISWILRGDTDPFVDAMIGIVDFGAPSEFGFLFGMPAAVSAPTRTSGSISGTITDANGDGASIGTASGHPLYQSFINNAAFQSLHDSAFSFSSGAPFATTPIPSASFGLPGTTFPGPAVDVNLMSMQLWFTTGGNGDQVALHANFAVEPDVVPEPASLSLLAMALAGLGVRRYRRK